jgi:hypothetical protein
MRQEEKIAKNVTYVLNAPEIAIHGLFSVTSAKKNWMQ